MHGAGQSAGPEARTFAGEGEERHLPVHGRRPSQLELFDHKPKLRRLHGQPIPDEFIKGKRFAFMDTFAKEVPKLLGTRRSSPSTAGAGTWVSECLPHMATASSMTWPSCARWRPNVFNHAPAKIFVNTGSPQFGRPSMGAWVTYGIGSEGAATCRASSCCSRVRAGRAAAPLLGQRLSADDLSGRAVPQRRRADSGSAQPAGRRRRNGSAQVLDAVRTT